MVRKSIVMSWLYLRSWLHEKPHLSEPEADTGPEKMNLAMSATEVLHHALTSVKMIIPQSVMIPTVVDAIEVHLPTVVWTPGESYYNVYLRSLS